MGRRSIFITGSSGFLGSAIARATAQSFDVIGGVHRSGEKFPWPVFLHDFEKEPAWSQIPKSIYAVVHAAFKPPDAKNSSQLQGDLESNERMAENVGLLASRLKAKLAVLITSGSVYGEHGNLITEKTPIAGSKHPDAYVASLAKVEEKFTHAAQGTPIIIARIFHPYGPLQSEKRLIPRIARAVLAGESIPLRQATDADDGISLNPIFVDDVAEATTRLLDLHINHIEIFNIGGPEVLTLGALVRAIAKELGKTAHFRPEIHPAADRVCSLDKLYNVISYLPPTRIRDGLQAALKTLIIEK